jgi:hypothetical protein
VAAATRCGPSSSTPTSARSRVGGPNPKFWSQNGPPEVLEKWAANQALFNLAMAMELPKVEITNTQVRRARRA